MSVFKIVFRVWFSKFGKNGVDLLKIMVNGDNLDQSTDYDMARFLLPSQHFWYIIL